MIISVLILTLISFDILAGKNSLSENLLETTTFIARILHVELDSEVFQKSPDSSFICFAFAFIIRAINISIIYDALKHLYEKEF